MLDVWYFAVCIQVPPTQMASYLGLMDALTAIDSTEDQLEAALDELSKTEPIMRHYAIPHLISLGLRDDDKLEIGAAVRRALVDALGELLPACSQSILRAWDALTRNADDQVVLVNLRAACDATAPKWTTLITESLPYFAVDDYVAEVTILAILATAVPLHPSLARGMVADETLSRLLSRGLAGHFGRLGFLVAVEAATLLGDHVSAVSLVDATRQFLTPGSPWEPDILATFARTQFGYPGRTAGLRAPADAVAAIALEAATFRAWDGAFPADPRPGPTDQAAVSRMGLAGVPNLAMALVLWQSVLWELACQYDPAAASHEIFDAWRPPDADFRNPVRVGLPVPPARLSAWRRRAMALANLRTGPAPIVLTARSSPKAVLSPTFHVAVTSPWMSFVNSTVPREVDSLALLRLLTSGLTAIRLVRVAQADDQAMIVPFLFHLEQILSLKVHSSSVMNASKGHTPEVPSMAPALLGLAATVERSLGQVGSGRYSRVEPVLFVEFLQDTSPSRSLAYLRARAVQPALAKWLRDALSGSIPGDLVGQGRWRSGAPGQTPAETALRIGASTNNARAAWQPLSFLTAYFDPDFPRPPEFAWFNRRQMDDWVSVASVLAAPHLDLDEWRIWNIAEVMTGGPTARIALETLRLAALMRQGIDSHLDLVGWVDDWHRLMDTIDRPTLLPRELRVVMLRLLDQEIDGTDREYSILEHLLDIEVELGWGTPYDRWMMFSLLGPTTKLPPETARRLRQRLLVALYHHERGRATSRSFADPWSVLDQRQNEELQARLMRRFIVEVGRLESDLHDSGISSRLESLWLSAHREGALREVELRRLGNSLDSTDRRRLVGAAPDMRLDGLRVHLLPAPATTSGSQTIDLFAAHSIESAERARAGARVAGVVAARQDDRVWVNVWLDDLIELSPTDDVRVGELVELGLHRTPLGVVAESPHSIERTPAAPLPGAVRDAVLRVAYGLDRPRVTVAVEGAPTIDLDALDEDASAKWMPDLVGLHTHTVPETSQTLAMWNGTGWVPVEFGVPELLAWLSDSTVRLVVVEARKGRLLVASSPGRLILLTDDSWDQEDLQRIDAAVPQRERMRGLALMVCTEVDDQGTPRLRLAAGGSAIDARAVRWAAVFDDDGDYEAQLDSAGRLVWDSGIDGMPLISVVGLPDRAAPFRPWQWNAREQLRAQVRGEAVASSSLQIRGRGLSDLRALLNVEPGSRFVLERAWRGGRFGTRAGVLVNQLRVEIEAESLNFGVRGAQTKQVKGRKVEVTYVTQNEGSGVRSGHAEGISDHDLLEGTEAQRREDVGMDLGRHRSVQGIVVEAPSVAKEGSVFEVWFDLGQSVSVVHIRRDAFEVPPRGVGDIVTATASRNRWTLAARQRRIRVRGLWKIERSAPRKGGTVLGTVPWEGSLENVLQDPYAPVLYLVRGPSLPHLTFIDARGRSHSDADLESGRVERTQLRVRSGGHVLWRTVVHVVAGGLEVDLAGDVVDNPPDPDAELDGVEIQLEPVGDGLYGVRRLFTVSRSIRESERFQPVHPADGLAAYLENPIPLEAEFIGSATVRLNTSWAVPQDGALTKDVPLAVGDEPWIDAGGYPRKGIRVVLTLDRGRVFASYRRVPMLGLDEAVEEFRRQGIPVGERHTLRQRLNYIDRQETVEGVYHRFEWGFGWACAIPESKLTIGLKAASSWPVVPFHGDGITRLLIGRDQTGFRIDIDVDAIEQGFLSEFYADAHQGVVSTATIEFEAGSRPRITALQVRDRRPRDLGPEGTYNDGHQVPIQRARLTDKAVDAILATGVEPGTRLAFVRLMTNLFVASGGQNVEFDFVAPRLGGQGALRAQDRVFLTVVRPFETRNRNDVGLELAATDVIGASKPLRVVVLRRDFSWRQDLLRRLLTDRKGAFQPHALVGDVYLVRLEQPRHDRDGRVLGVIKGSLARPVRMLHSYITRSSDACFAVVDTTTDRLGLEIRPNVVFRLQSTDFEADAPVADRSIVRVLSHNGRLFLTTALGGDGSYVPKNGRPVILLPMQSLLRPADTLDTALRSGGYSVAGLPELQPSASRGVDREFARRLLTTPHPRVALLQKGDQRWLLKPLDDDDLRAATYSFEADGSVLATLHNGKTERLAWDQLSFRDAGAAELRSLAARPAWVYHDQTTAQRSPWGDNAPMRAVPLRPAPRREHDPVFFTRELGLRYEARELERVGFPARELLAGRTLRANAEPFVVAGPVRRSRGIVGLWLETAPGHIVEVTSSMFVATTANSLTKINWGHFAMGDLITLSNHRSTRTELATLRIEGWSPGPRGAFGRRALLPILSVDAATQTVTLGGGAWTLARPIEADVEFPPAGRMVWLARDGMRIAPKEIDLGSLEPGNVVLVGLAGGLPTVLGLGHVRVELVAQAGSPDEWIIELLRKGDASLLGLLGGVLPFTVHALEGARIMLDRGAQQGVFRPGSTVPCQPLGVVNGEVVMRAGSRIYRCAADAVVPGLPSELLAAAVEALAQRPTLLWLLSDERRGLRLGDRAATGEEIRVEPIATLSSDYDCGVLCWDTANGSAVWLPSGRMGWTSPNYEEVQTWVSTVRAHSVGTVVVAVQPDGVVSVTDTIAARYRLRNLRNGDLLRIEVIGDAFVADGPDRVRYLARLYLGDVILEYVTRADQPVPGPGPRFGEIESVDVSEGGASTVRVADQTAREFHAALPTWFVRSGEHPLAVPARFDSYRGVGAPEDGYALDAALVRAASSSPSENPAALLLASQWLEQRGEVLFGLNSVELDLPPALAAVIILDAAADSLAARAAVVALRQIGLRSTMSLHLSPLLSLWLAEPAERPGLWRRLDAISVAPRMSYDEVDRIARLCSAIRSRVAAAPDDQLAIYGESLAASIGVHSQFDTVAGHASLLRDLSDLGRALVPPERRLTAQDALVPAQVLSVRNALLQSLVGLPVTLLGVPNSLQDPDTGTVRQLLSDLPNRLLI